MKKLLPLLILFFSVNGFTQDTAILSGPYVIVHKDPRLEQLVKKQASISVAAKKLAGRTMRGYRLLVVNTNSRDEAMAAKSKIYAYFPDQKSYLTYQSPFFKIKAGNYQTREEAKHYQQLMNAIFPKGVFIVSDIIEVKAEKEDETAAQR